MIACNRMREPQYKSSQPVAMTKPENSTIRRSKVGGQRTNRKTLPSDGPKLESSALRKFFARIPLVLGRIIMAQIAVAHACLGQHSLYQLRLF